MAIEIQAISAIGLRGELGYRGGLPWKHPEDLKMFKVLTEGGIIIMGGRTWRSLTKILPNRIHWVLSAHQEAGGPSSDPHCDSASLCFFQSKEQIISNLLNIKKQTNVFIIGGSTIYKLFEQECSKWIVTHFESAFEADCFFPMEVLRDRPILSQSPCEWGSLKNYRAQIIHYGARHDSRSKF